MRQQRPNLSAAPAVHNGEKPHLSLCAFGERHALKPGEFGDSRIHIGAAARRCQRLVVAERRQDARLNLRTVRNEKNLAFGS